ncbi:MAG: dienelactone hydrolase family protein [Candidatus Rickettsia vulgarisii]
MSSAILPYPEIKSLTEECKKLVVLLHGIGSDGNDLISLVPFIAKDLPDCHFISPHGVEPYDTAPYGRQWFSRSNYNLNTNYYNLEVIGENINLLESIIKEKQQQLNLTNKDTIIIGFSQGTMVGLYLNLIQKEPFNCVVGFSGKLMSPLECSNKTTPVCLVHGELDDVLEINCMDEIIEYLQKNNIRYSSYRVPNLAHSIDAKGLEFALNFIKEQQ